MSTRLDAWKPAALCALALGACQAVPKSQPATALTDGDSAAVRTQEPADGPSESFRAWAYSLPEVTALPPMTGTMSFHMKGDVSKIAGSDWDAIDLPVGAEPDIEMTFNGRLEIESWTRLRMQMNMVMSLGILRIENPAPLEVGLLLIADGETIWIEPDWSKAWFLDQLEGQATGFEHLVFTLGAETMREFMDAVAGVMEGEAADWYRSSLECASNPACLTRLLADRITVESFARRGKRVVADLSMDMNEWLPPEMNSSGFDQPLRYRCEFDVVTGAVLHTSYTMDLADQGMTMRFLQDMELATRPFAEDRFRYELPKGRAAFPLDLFLRPALAGIRMESGQRPPDKTDDDLPF